MAAFGESLCDSEAVLIEGTAHSDDSIAAARDQLAARVQGVVFGQQYLMLDYDCPRPAPERATAITPGLNRRPSRRSPTRSGSRCAPLVPRRDVNAIMDELAAIGAKAILASDIRSAASGRWVAGKPAGAVIAC